MSRGEKLDYSGHKLYLKKPEKCKRPIGGAKICNSRNLLKINSFEKLRGEICTRYKCQKCGADYYVANLTIVKQNGD